MLVRIIPKQWLSLWAAENVLTKDVKVEGQRIQVQVAAGAGCCWGSLHSPLRDECPCVRVHVSSLTLKMLKDARVNKVHFLYDCFNNTQKIQIFFAKYLQVIMQ